MKTKRLSFFNPFILVFFLLSSLFVFASCSYPSSVDVSESSLALYPGETRSLIATSTDEDALVLFKSSDSKVASVRGNGKNGRITAVGEGECIVTAYDDNGAEKDCKVVVTATGVRISHTVKEVDLAYANSFLLKAETEDGGDVDWSSSDTAVATVTSNGYVTCLEEGEAKITASRRGGKATCNVTVFDSFRPEDYYIMKQGKNADVMADPGHWYYWPNGSDTAGKSIFQNAGFTSTITKLESDNGFAYRYQPGGVDNTGLKVGDSYKISFKVKLNISTTLTGKKSQAVTANEWTSFSYTGTVSSSEPFYFTVKKPSSFPNGGISVEIKDFEIGANKSTDSYDVIAGKNAEVVAHPGIWYYWTNGSDKVSSASYNNKELKLNITKLADSQGMYIRYQPGDKDKTGLAVGDQYTISFDITMNTSGSIGGMSSATVSTAGTFVKYTYTGTVKADAPFNLTLKGIDIPSSGTLTVTIKNISVTKVQQTANSLPTGNKASALSKPGDWYYSAGSGDTVETITNTGGTISAKITKLSSGEGITLYHQVNKLLVGDKYTAKYQVTMNTTGTVGGSASASVTTANAFVDYIYSGVVSSTDCLAINLKGVTIPSGGLTFTLKEEKVTSLPQGNMATVVANPDVWHYNSGGSATFNTLPRISSDGTNMGVDITGFGGDFFYFRYQPGAMLNCQAGDSYKVTFVATCNKATTLNYGKNPNGEITDASKTPLEANTPTNCEYIGVVGSANNDIFAISIDKNLGSASITITNLNVEKI